MWQCATKACHTQEESISQSNKLGFHQVFLPQETPVLKPAIRQQNSDAGNPASIIPVRNTGKTESIRPGPNAR